MSHPALSPENVRREIVDLHDFFVAWYTGQADGDVTRVADALAPGFELVSPDGECLDRGTVLDAIRGRQATYYDGEFDIEIRNVTCLARGPELVTARYEEHQRTDSDATARISTATFRAEADAPNGLRWAALQETWLDT